MKFREVNYSITATAEELSKRLGISYQNALDTIQTINYKDATTPGAVRNAVQYVCHAYPSVVVDTLREMGWWQGKK